MATVYLAQDLKHHRPVAIKVLRPELGAVLGADRFLREIEIAAQLAHPHILPLHDSGDAGALLYYVMPYVEGESLRDRLTREGQLPLDEALQIARETADALSHAHSHNVIHRDIKSENILLEAGHAVVSDFGLARAIRAAGGDELTTTGIAVGTPAYMSPEQASTDARIDGRADIYALGCVLYEMLAGEPPFRGSSAQAVRARHAHDSVPPLHTVRQAVPPPVERAVLKALEKAPADRFATAAEFADALTRPMEAGRPRRARLTTAAAVAAVLVAAGWWGIHAVSARAASINRLAVLPLENLTGDTTQDYFVEGMHDALVTELAKIGALSVISRSSVLSYRHTTKPLPEIARELHVDAVVEGSVMLAGDSVRITAQLIAGPTDRHLWADTYVKDRRNVLQLYSDVTRAIARQVRVALTPEERGRLTSARPVDPQANDLYLKGRYYCAQFAEAGFTRGIGFYRRAIDQDPTFALAYAGLAECYGVLPLFTFAAPQDAFRKAKAAVTRALELDSTLGTAHATLAQLEFLFEYDWAGADREFRKALALAPGDAHTHGWYSAYLVGMGHFPAAVAESQRALELDPLTLTTSLQLGWTYFNTRRHDESIAQLKKTLELDSTFSYTHMELAWNYAKQARFADATRECATALQAASSPDDQVLLASCAWVYAHAGRRADALPLLQKVLAISKQGWVDPYNVAAVYEGLGDVDQGIEWLRRAIRQRSSAISGLRVDPFLDGLRADPRFPLLLKQVRLSN